MRVESLAAPQEMRLPTEDVTLIRATRSLGVTLRERGLLTTSQQVAGEAQAAASAGGGPASAPLARIDEIAASS